MFNLFRKQQKTLAKHQYKNLLISLPSHWRFELEGDDQEACYDPKSQSTLRINILTVTPPADTSSEDIKKVLAANQSYITTSKGYLLTKPVYKESVESGKNISLITWRLINDVYDEKIIGVLTYTVLTNEKDSEQEIEIFKLVENSLQTAELS